MKGYKQALGIAVALGHCWKCRFTGFDFFLLFFLLPVGFGDQSFRQFPQEPEVQHQGTVSKVETGRKKPICHLIPVSTGPALAQCLRAHAASACMASIHSFNKHLWNTYYVPGTG